MGPDSHNDDALVSAVARGDAAAFGALYQRRSSDVYRFALHLTGSPAAADDIAQEVFLRVMRDASRYRPGRATVRAWLCGIARNVARQRFDRERSFVPLVDESEALQRSTRECGDVDTEFARTERIEAVQRAVVRLPIKYREVIALCDLQEMSYAEAARTLGCAVGTVRSRLHRGRALLAARLTAVENQERSWKTQTSKCLA